ncbi:MAG: c-type cytochrome [Sphingobacteriales bacterium]|nr:MAG: c-type cytochrome [Sphingobacteriales bacterium]
MKTLLKAVLFLVLAICVLLAVGATVIFVRGIPKYDPVKYEAKVEVTPERVERGMKLASMLCNHCHLNEKTNKLTGRSMTEVEGFGEINSLNITQHPEAGIGKWTDGELIAFIRTGIRPDGQYVPPYMVKLPKLSDEDMNSIIAFLRSDNPYVQPDPTELSPTKPNFFAKFLSNIAFKPFEMPSGPVPEPDTTNIVAWGEYLTLYQLECYSCHSKDFSTNNFAEPEKSEGYFGGGIKLIDMDGKPILTRNLTPDKETGIGNWTEEQFVKTLKYGIREGKPAVRYPMLPYSQLTDSEAKAIFAFLRTVPPLKNEIEQL